MSTQNMPLLTEIKQDSIDFDQSTQNVQTELSDNERILAVAQRILREHLNAFKELAK